MPIEYPPVLDACCGSRMFWFDKEDARALFQDIRTEEYLLKDSSSSGGHRKLSIAPDRVVDFTDMPYPDNVFKLVVFDPPHFRRNGSTGWMAKKYGTLTDDWQKVISDGFLECFRVLAAGGALVFKWCATEIPVSKVLALTEHKPLFGHKSGKQQNTHWICFIK